jgi:hypothetical protein
LILGIVAVATGSLALLLWTVAIAGLAGGLAAWSQLAWRGLEVSAKFRPGRAFSGETNLFQAIKDSLGMLGSLTWTF